MIVKNTPKNAPKSLQLRLYNSLSQKKEIFTPMNSELVTMYVCGPTVYRNVHIGNARPTVVFDMVFRVLRFMFGNVVYTRNITDVDDKIIQEAQQNNETIRELTDKIIDSFHQDMENLNNLSPTEEPRATNHIDGMIEMVKTLIQKGYAYATQNHVFFDISKFDEYGEISKMRMNDMIAGARVEESSIKKNPGDFVLWKPASEDEPFWPSPWGNGRPGWHLECSVMSMKHSKVLDIHAGGHDLMFPHHENSNAQSRCAHGLNTFSRYWMHNGMINVVKVAKKGNFDNSGDESKDCGNLSESRNSSAFQPEKMSKSLGNVVILKDAIRKYSGVVVRYFLLSSHYRKDMLWSEELIKSAAKSLNGLLKVAHSEAASEMWNDKCNELVKKNSHGNEDRNESEKSPSEKHKIDEKVLECLLDDLNTPMAIARLHEMAKFIKDLQKKDLDVVSVNDELQEELQEAVNDRVGQRNINVRQRIAVDLLAGSMKFMGIWSDKLVNLKSGNAGCDADGVSGAGVSGSGAGNYAARSDMHDEYNARNYCQNYDQSYAQNYDQNSKKCSLTEKEILNYIEKRNKARKEKNFQLSDEIRDFLRKNGVILKDGVNGTTFEIE